MPSELKPAVLPPTADRLAGLLDPWRARAPVWEEVFIGSFAHAGAVYRIPRYRFLGPAAGHEPIRLGVFAGVHGDEPAGSLALADFAAALAGEPARAAGYELSLYPACNPAGLAAGTRGNGGGQDLNREFWRNSAEPEIAILEAELIAQPFDGLITLHTDDTSEGLYGYAHGRVLNEALLKPALAAAAALIPRDERERIDGFCAQGGVLRDCFPGVLSAPPQRRSQPFDLIFETPGHAPLDLQARAAAAALNAILAEYRGFIAYGQDL